MQEVQYISDANGNPIGVIVPIELWRELESGTIKDRINDLKKLFKKTQSLPSIRPISDEDISKEIEEHRHGR